MQIKWSHYWPRHLNLELAGDVNLEFFVINYLFGQPGAEPWDYWLQCLRQNHRDKLPVSEFCQSVLQQARAARARMPRSASRVFARGPRTSSRRQRRDSTFRFLTVTNSHDLGRYNTRRSSTRSSRLSLRQTMSRWSSRTTAPRRATRRSGDSFADRTARPAIEYVSDFTDKRELIRLYKSCDAFVSAHRGEGFGMKILDAMACGLPVITPLFGGPTAYCRAR